MNRRLIHIMSSVPEITVKGCWSLDQVSMRISMGDWSSQLESYTAITRKVVGKSARDNPKRYCDCFWVHCSSKKFERMAREAADLCLRVLKESNKSRFDSYSVRNRVLIISHITFRYCCVHMFCEQPLSK